MKHFTELHSLRYKAMDGRTTHSSMRRACRNLVNKFDSKNELAIELNEYITNYGEWNLSREVIIPLFQEAINLPESQTVLVRLNWFPNQHAWTFAALIAKFEKVFRTDSESLDLFSKNKGE